MALVGEYAGDLEPEDEWEVRPQSAFASPRRAFAAHRAQRCASDAGDPYNLKRCEALTTARQALAPQSETS